MNTTLTPDMANELFKEDFTKHYKFAQKFPNWNGLTEGQKAAIVDMTYNMGPGWMNQGRFAGLANALTNKDWQGVNDIVISAKNYSSIVGDRAKDNVALLTQGNMNGSVPTNSTIAQTNSQTDTPEVHLSTETMNKFNEIFASMNSGDINVMQSVAAAGGYD